MSETSTFVRLSQYLLGNAEIEGVYKELVEDSD